MNWYYAQNDQRFGPVEEGELRRLASTGRLRANDLVWREGFQDWRPAAQVEVLFPGSPGPAPSSFTPPQMVAPAPAMPAVPATSTYAGFGARFAAFLLDLLIMVGLSLVVGFALGIFMGLMGLADASSIEVMGNLLGILLNWLYFAGLESSARMATVGKRALGLVVTDLEGRRIGFGRATGRHFGKILSALVLGIGYLSILYNPRKQAWHDQMAGCLVLRCR
jgi:uncharacterized RDD family membrane protein YckC